MLEDYLMGNKIIRSYAKMFSEKELNRMIRCTLILGIQTLKEEIPNFNHYSPQELENVIIESIKGESYPHELIER
jgi:hypothetical protein